MTSQCSFSFQKNDFITSFSKIKGGSETGNPATNTQYSSVDGHSDGLQLFIFSYLFKGGPDDFFCLLGSLFLLLLMDPTTLFPNIGNLTKIRIHPLRFDIHCSSNIHSAMADKNTQSFHKNNLLPLGASGKAQGVHH